MTADDPSEGVRQGRETQPTASAPNPDCPPVYRFEDLAGDSSVILIGFDGETYRLQRTRNNRLLLQK